MLQKYHTKHLNGCHLNEENKERNEDPVSMRDLQKDVWHDTLFHNTCAHQNESIPK